MNAFISIGKKEKEEIESQFNFLFLVHNEIEFEVMIESMEDPTGFNGILKYVDNERNKQVYYLGKLEKYDIVLTKTADMGSIDINASNNVINNSIDLWKPNFVIMVGVAAGMKESCKIGDVVIAKEIVAYERVRKGKNGDIERAPRFHSVRLYNLFDSVNEKIFMRDQPNFTEFGDQFGKEIGGKIRKGTLLSGEKLLDDDHYKKELLKDYPEAIALEMEGVGVASACINKRVYDWAVIKGICDFGDGNKSYHKYENQTIAMKQAVRLVKEVFSDENNFDKSELKVPYYRLKNASVLISGCQDPSSETFKNTEAFCKELTRGLIENQFRIVTGYGRWFGEYIVNGVLQTIYDKFRDIDSVCYDHYLRCYPFPRSLKPDMTPSENKRLTVMQNTNRKLLTNEIGSVLFLFGYKSINGQPAEVSGMQEEFELAAARGAYVVPVGATGGKAQELWENVNGNLTKYYPNRTEVELSKIAQGLQALNAKYDFEKSEDRKKLTQTILEFLAYR